MTKAMVNPLSIARNDVGSHRRLVYQLRQAGGPQNLQLAHLLAGCAPQRRCRSGACILCGRELQRIAAGLIESEIRAPARQSVRGRMSTATIIPASGIAAPDALTAEVCRTAIADLKTAIKDCNLSPSICGFDVSFNEDDEGVIPSHWVAHGHPAFADWLSEKDEAALRDAVEAHPLVSRRVRVDKLDGRANGSMYVVKPDRGRRVGYINDKHPARAPFRDTRRRELRPSQAVALAQVEHELGLAHRLIVTGIVQDAIKVAFEAFYWPQDGP